MRFMFVSVLVGLFFIVPCILVLGSVFVETSFGWQTPLGVLLGFVAGDVAGSWYQDEFGEN